MGSSLAAGAALPEGIIPHGEDLALIIEEQDVINATSYLLNLSDIFNLDWLIIDKQLSPDLRSTPPSKKLHVLLCRIVLFNFVHKNISFLRENKHPCLCKSYLSHFCSPREIRDLCHVGSVTISNASYFN